MRLRQLKVTKRGRIRSLTVSPLGLRRDVRAENKHLTVLDEPPVDLSGRPRTRGDCELGPRPCPWIGCRHNLYLDVKENGAIKFNFPHLEPWEMADSCALDVADRGGVVLDQVAVCLGLTRERSRQLELWSVGRLRQAVASLAADGAAAMGEAAA